MMFDTMTVSGRIQPWNCTTTTARRSRRMMTGKIERGDIEATTIPPTNDFESAIVRALVPGNYTAVVRGANNSTGIGLAEVYNLP